MKKEAPKLFLFSKKIHKTTIRKSLRLGVYTPRPCKFRSFFAFLKPKPFVNDLRDLFCQTFIINPRYRTLNGLVRNTKKFTIENLKTYLFNPYRITIKGVSNLTIAKLNNRLTKRLRHRINFSLFRHRIYNYTTPKRLPITKYIGVGRTSPCWEDFRVGCIARSTTHNYPLNVSTISTYNWKIIT